jgi:hypothetical protein
VWRVTHTLRWVAEHEEEQVALEGDCRDQDEGCGGRRAVGSELGFFDLSGSRRAGVAHESF